MKKLSFLALAVAGMLFAACSSDKDVEGATDQGFDGIGKGYFKINLNLPTTPVVSTRAWEETGSGTLDNGDPVEYGVKSLILLLFEGTSEADATLKQVISLTPDQENLTTDDPNQITTKQEYIAELDEKPATGKSLFALAVVNGKGSIEMASASGVYIAGSTTITTGCKLSDLQDALATSANVSSNSFVYDDGGTNYFFMTNAVLSNEQGGTALPTTATGNMHILAPVNASYIYATSDAASSGNAATDIYVERGVAKVTLNTTADADYLKTTALVDKTGNLTAAFDGWCLDNTNKSSYIVRQVPTDAIWNLTSEKTLSGDKYRFIGGNKVDAVYGASPTAGYRTYWAKDPNYDIAYDVDNFSKAAYATDKKTAATALYCLENTFTVPYQSTQNTTCALLGIKLVSSGDFYVIGADRKTLYREIDVKNRVVAELMATTAFSTWYATAGGGATLNGSDITVNWTAAGSGKKTVESVEIPGTKITVGSKAGSDFTMGNSEGTVDGVNLTGIITTLNDAIANVEYFADGVAYYTIRIQHFGDELTPWNNGEYTTAPKESGIDDIYPTDVNQAGNYLGRYGVVRNNWYELQIGEILKIGSSTVPDLSSDTHPDDELEAYIKARINILSWAKRTQPWDLK
ncbi:MAG: Mfa1 fimbrilin C-terminal domain-containing protein [Prevotella sp.]|nr:Mfa1 fimbrilin C-terminal domain-containing protein [Prevotella sp.]